MIAIAAESNISFTAEEVMSYLVELDEKDEFDDIELDEATLAAISGGGAGGYRGCCSKNDGIRGSLAQKR